MITTQRAFLVNMYLTVKTTAGPSPIPHRSPSQLDRRSGSRRWTGWPVEEIGGGTATGVAGSTAGGWAGVPPEERVVVQTLVRAETRVGCSDVTLAKAPVVTLCVTPVVIPGVTLALT